MRYRPDLDGIRALAVLAVMASHTGLPLTGGGWMGVDLFFVLSGFLITTLMLVEHGNTGTVSLKDFYLRRILRLYPALLLVLAVGGIFYRDLGEGGTPVGYLRTAAAAGLYLEDFFIGFGRTVGFLGHTWSLAVEEQFYLLWPPIFLWALRRGRDPLRWALGGAVVAWTIGAFSSFHRTPDGIPDAAYYLPWCRFSQILAGCVLAFLVQRGVRAPRQLRTPVGGWLTAGILAALVLAAAQVDRVPHLAWESPLCAVLTCGLIWHLTEVPNGVLRRVLGGAPLAWLGRRSYAIYLIHLPLLVVIAHRLPLDRTAVALVMMVGSVMLAALSYRFVELPLLRLKRHFQPLQRGSDSPTPVVHQRSAN